MPNIQVIEPNEAEGLLNDIYCDLIKTRGKVASVHKIQSLNPQSIIDHMALYQTIMFGKSPLRRVVREMMAVVVSASNECNYCITHHAEAVQHYWKDADRVLQLEKDYTQCELKPVEMLLCEYAEDLTKNPGTHNGEKWANTLREEGLEDKAVLDAALVVAYFNFVNRLVISLGVALEENPGGYNY